MRLISTEQAEPLGVEEGTAIENERAEPLVEENQDSRNAVICPCRKDPTTPYAEEVKLLTEHPSSVH